MDTLIIFLILFGIFLLGYALRDWQIKSTKCFGELMFDKKRNRFRMCLGDALDLDNLPKTTKWVLLKVNPNADLPDSQEKHSIE